MVAIATLLGASLGCESLETPEENKALAFSLSLVTPPREGLAAHVKRDLEDNIQRTRFLEDPQVAISVFAEVRCNPVPKEDDARPLRQVGSAKPTIEDTGQICGILVRFFAGDVVLSISESERPQLFELFATSVKNFVCADGEDARACFPGFVVNMGETVEDDETTVRVVEKGWNVVARNLGLVIPAGVYTAAGKIPACPATEPRLMVVTVDVRTAEYSQATQRSVTIILTNETTGVIFELEEALLEPLAPGARFSLVLEVPEGVDRGKDDLDAVVVLEAE